MFTAGHGRYRAHVFEGSDSSDEYVGAVFVWSRQVLTT